MPPRRTRGTVFSTYRAGLVALALAITATAALAGSSRGSREPERISVTTVSGAVSVTMAGSATHVVPNSTVGLPARIVTGDDGTLGLTQAGTNITIAADSDVEIPAEAADGQLIARLVQRRGNVFYDVAHRDVGTLRVETPFLVAVIKGTQFNVAVQDESTTISLFQGRLEIRTPDASDIIQLNAGEIAIRGRADNSIRVLSMNERRVDAPRAGEAVVARTAPAADVSVGGQRAGVPIAADTRDGSTVAARVVDAAQAALAPGSSMNGAGAVLPAESLVAVAGAPTMRVDSGVGLGPDVGHGPSVGASVDLGASTNLTTVNIASSTNLGAGGANVSAAAGAALGGAGASLGASLNVGTTGSPSISLGASTSLNAGSAGGASLGANLSVGAGSPSVSLGASASVGGASLGATVSVGGASPGLLGTGVNVGVDLGNSGSAAPPAATPPSAATPAAPAVALPVLGAVTLPTLPVLPVVTTPTTPSITTPAPKQPAPPLVGVIGKLLGHP